MALVIGIDEAAKELKLKRDVLIEKLNNGDIPAYRDGRNWKIPVNLLVQYCENRAISEAQERRQLREAEECNE